MSQANNPSAIISTERVFFVQRRRVFAAFEFCGTSDIDATRDAS